MQRSLARWICAARSAALASLALVAASAAQARNETLRWTHADPGRVTGFRVHQGSAAGVYHTIIDVGLPQAATPGNYATTLAVPDAENVYFAITAYDGSGVESPYSNEKLRAAPPPTTSGGGSSGSSPLPRGVLLSASFDGAAAGNFLSGWADTQANNSFASDDALFDVRPLDGSQVLATSSTATDIHSHYVAPGSASWSNYEVRGRVLGSDAWSRLGVTAHSSYPNADSYYRLGSHWQTGEWEIYAKPSSLNVGLTCAPRGTGVIPEPGLWYRFRFQVEVNGGDVTLRGKLWPEGSVQPDAWQAQCSDRSSNGLTAGTVGLWAGANGTKAWDDVEVVDLSTPQLGPPGRPVIFVP